MPARSLVIGLQVLLGAAVGSLSAAMWIMASNQIRGLNWFDRMARHGLADLAIIVAIGTVLGFAVWLPAAVGARSSANVASPSTRRLTGAVILACVGTLIVHFQVMSILPRDPSFGPDTALIDAFSRHPSLVVATLVPLLGALAAVWWRAKILLELVQLLVGGALSVYAALMLGFGMSEGPDRGWIWLPIVLFGALVGIAIWLVGLVGSLMGTRVAYPTLMQLVTAIALACLGMLAVYGIIELILTQPYWRRPASNMLDTSVRVLLPLLMPLLPLAGALAGYWLARKRTPDPSLGGTVKPP